MKQFSTPTLKLTASLLGVLMLFLSSLEVMAQSPATTADVLFKVLAAQGDVATSKATEVTKLAAGKSLYRDQIVTVTGKSYLGLVHKTGKAIEIREPGTYKVWDLDAVVTNTASTSLTKKYAKYVFGELQREDDKGMRKNHQQYMAVTGAVSRAAAKTGVVKAYIPASTTISDGIPTSLSWAPVANAGGYVVTIQDMFDTIVWQKETIDTTLAVDFNELKGLANTRTGIIKVGTKARGMKNAIGYPIKLLPELEATKLKQELDEYSKQNNQGDQSTPLNDLVQGYFFESAGLNLNALASFRAAMIKAPEVEDYKLQYQDYLMRTGLLVVKE
jgi:hypothetical protein